MGLEGFPTRAQRAYYTVPQASDTRVRGIAPNVVEGGNTRFSSALLVYGARGSFGLGFVLGEFCISIGRRVRNKPGMRCRR